MYAIKMNSDKTLVTTVHATIYQHEKNADTLIFIVPRYYEGTNLADCSLMLKYILPDGSGKSEELEMDPIPYNKDYYRYHLKVNTRFTAVPGEIVLWLSAMNVYDNVILKSSETEVEITPSKNISDYMNTEDMDQLDKLTITVARLESEKADDLLYSEVKDEDGNITEANLQLSAKGAPIGAVVTLKGIGDTDDDENWEDMDPEKPDEGGESWGDMEDDSDKEPSDGEVWEPMN